MSWQRNRPGGHGYVNPKYRDKQHRDWRAALIAAFTPGQPCGLCGEPMYPPTRNLHADHTSMALTHRRCNVKDGARIARARQTSSRLRW